MSVRIGIDLGTTNSAVAMVYDDGPMLVPRGSMKPIFEPSVVRFDLASGSGVWTAGEQADQAAGHVIRSIKRLMGRTYSDAMAKDPTRHFANRSLKLGRRHRDDLQLQLFDDHGNHLAAVWPQEISAHILRHLRTRVERELGTDVEAAVVTVPAYFEDSHRAATLDAARLAGLRVLEPLLDEPTAAALAFSSIIGLASGEPLLVVDWGGGTLDITILISDGTSFTELAIDGDLYLGGDDLDVTLAEHVLTRKKLSLDLMQDPANNFRLLKAVQSAKHLLSRDPVASIVCSLDGSGAAAIRIAESVTRNEFENLARPFLDKVASIVERCISSHRDVPVSEIRNVLLVGGSTLIPAARTRLQSLLPGATLRNELNPMHAVALGAAVYAEMRRDNVTRICPYGYSVVSTAGASSDLIGCDQEVPTPEHLPYRINPTLRTSYDNQTVFRLTLQRFTKHSAGLRNVSKLGSMRVFGRHLPPQPKGAPVECEFWLDQNKELRGRVRIEGSDAIEMERISLAEVGARAALTQLTDKCLEAEALIEGNAGQETPLIKRLREVWIAASEALDAESLEDSEQWLLVIGDLLEQAESAAREKSGPKTDEQERQRILGWAVFYEQDLLPRFGYLLGDETLKPVVEAISRIRIMSRTGAPAQEMALHLKLLEETLRDCPAGHILIAYRDSQVLGVSAGLTKEIGQLCEKASSELRNHTPFPSGTPVAQALKAKADEAKAQWLAWRESIGISIVTPDLVRGHGDDGAD
jgi:molecular chaperone DnaK (HSP70)